jgi:hypothetical protein
MESKKSSKKYLDTFIPRVLVFVKCFYDGFCVAGSDQVRAIYCTVEHKCDSVSLVDASKVFL